MAVPAVAIYVVANLVKHGRRREPLAIFRREAVQRAQRREQTVAAVADIQGVFAIDVVMVDRLHDRFPSLGFDLPPGARAAVVVRRHLSKNPVAQAERRIAEALQLEPLQQFVIHRWRRQR